MRERGDLVGGRTHSVHRNVKEKVEEGGKLLS